MILQIFLVVAWGFHTRVPENRPVLISTQIQPLMVQNQRVLSEKCEIIQNSLPQIIKPRNDTAWTADVRKGQSPTQSSGEGAISRVISGLGHRGCLLLV